MILDQEKIVRLMTVLLPYVRIYLVEPYVLKGPVLTPGIDLAIDAGHVLSQEHLIGIRNILGTLNLSQSVNVIDITQLTEEERTKLLKNAIPWKN